MADASPIQSQPGPFRNDILALVASQDLDTVPDEFDPPERFVINSIRAATRRSDLSSMCAFVYSEAPRPDTIELGFSRIAHMQDGYGELSGYIVATNQDVNNGMSRLCSQASPNRIMEELEEMSLHERCTVIWDPKSSVATIYPSGVASPDDHIRKPINVVDTDLTRDEVNSALTIAYEENLKTPSAHTARLWVKLTLVDRAEDELERHIKGQLTTFFLGRQRPIKVLSQTNTDVGRCDLLFLQRRPTGAPTMMGVLELKVLRGPETKNKADTREGLSQGYHYRQDLDLPFAILALFDVAIPPSDDLTGVLSEQLREHLQAVLVVRLPIYNAPRAWCDSTVATGT